MYIFGVKTPCLISFISRFNRNISRLERNISRLFSAKVGLKNYKLKKIVIMAYFYRTRKKCYIKNEAKEEKFFAVPVTKGTLGMEEIAKEISSKSIAKESAILAVLKELSIIMKNKLGDGYNLKLDGIGTFGVAITSLGFDKEENITPRRVKFSKMTYRADRDLVDVLQDMKFVKEPPAPKGAITKEMIRQKRKAKRNRN